MTKRAAPKKGKVSLSDDQKRWVVTQNAQHRRPSAVAKAFGEEFAFEISKQLVEVYDPTKAAGSNLSDEFRVLFEKTRKAYDEDRTGIPTLNKIFRLRILNDLALDALERNDGAELRATLKQIALEDGGGYTNKRELSGPDGAAISVQVTDADRARALAALIARTKARKGA